jgi:hypothetical protein
MRRPINLIYCYAILRSYLKHGKPDYFRSSIPEFSNDRKETRKDCVQIQSESPIAASMTQIAIAN